ncbi:MAG TPA: DinB family protein, partial [Hyalangium sp.]|nr:DinB family protein [Hyalangium sp.]
AAGNYFLANFAGAKPPEGINLEKYENSLTKKADIQKAMKDSFAHVEKALMSAADADLEKPVEFFGRKMTVRGMYMVILSHAHEHLGQSIAHARGSGLVPPWTAAQEAAAKEKAGKKPEGQKK